MSSSSITITNASIISALTKYAKDYSGVIAEYVWNSFDAGASTVKIDYAFQQKIGNVDIGYPTLTISDDGSGWDMSDRKKVAMFLDSPKRGEKTKYKSLPHGSRGIGRFSFHAIANKAEWITKYEDRKYRLVLHKSSINKYEIEEPDGDCDIDGVSGTRVSFDIDNNEINQTFFEETLPNELLKHFAWFLCLFPQKSIELNGTRLDLTRIIKRKETKNFNVEGNDISVEIVQWKKALANKEYSKIYFLDDRGNEVFKLASGLNNKSDVFFHSAYARSELFSGYIPSLAEIEEEQQQVSLDSDQKKLVDQAKKQIKVFLEDFRRPYIEEISEDLIKRLKDERILPLQEELNVPEEDFNELVRQTYVIAPEIFTKVSSNNKKFTVRLLATLMGTEEKTLIPKIIDEIYKLTSEQKDKLEDLLNRTSLGNIIETVSEIDHRLQTLSDLETLVYDPEKYKDVLEVEHLQKILDNEFWIFGEEYRLVSSTEGPLKKTIDKYAREILKNEEYETESSSRKELDLFLSKQIVIPGPNGNTRTRNIVVELKRPNIKLGRKELNQIKDYKEAILKEPICNGSGVEWTFILIGRDFANDNEISSAIKNAKNHGESNKGLVECVYEQNYKIYVKRWSDLIRDELRPQYEYLRKKLIIKQRHDATIESPDETVSRHAS